MTRRETRSISSGERRHSKTDSWTLSPWAWRSCAIMSREAAAISTRCVRGLWGPAIRRTAVEQAEENHRLTSSRYAQGLATSSDVLDAESALVAAKSQYFGALYGFMSSYAKLQAAVWGAGWGQIDQQGASAGLAGSMSKAPAFLQSGAPGAAPAQGASFGSSQPSSGQGQSTSSPSSGTTPNSMGSGSQGTSGM